MGRSGAARSRSRCASRARRITCATRCSPASPRCAISARRAQATPTWGSSRRSSRGSSPGRACFVVTRAIVATGSYGPKGFDPRWDVPQGAQEADGVDALIHAVREPDREGGGLDQDLRRLSVGAERRDAPHVLAGGAEARRGDARSSSGRSVSRARVRATDGDSPRGARRRRDGGARRRWRSPATLQLMERARRGALPHARRRRRGRAVSRLEEGRRSRAARSIKHRRAMLQAGARRPASPSAWAATWACSRTATNARELELHGRLRHDAHRRRCARPRASTRRSCTSTASSARSSPDCSRISSPCAAIRRATSTRIAQVAFVMKNGVIYKRP